MGIAAGAVGAGIQETGLLLGLQRLAAKLAGGTMLVIGLLAIVKLASGERHTLLLPKFLQDALLSKPRLGTRPTTCSSCHRNWISNSHPSCGWLYAFILFAAGTASPFLGAMVMFFFGLGSVPALTALVLGATALFGNSQRLILGHPRFWYR